MRSTLRLAAAALALVTASLSVGCAATSSDDEGASADAISAKEANAQQRKLEPLLTNVEASQATRRLGIVRWDVFAGRQTESVTPGAAPFEGAVFYATDPNGDVRYFFAFDSATGAYAAGQLDPQGRSVTTPMDQATVEALFVDIASLRDRVNAGGSGRCAVAVGVAALSGVLAAGVTAYLALPVVMTGLTSVVSATFSSMGTAIIGSIGLTGGISAVVGVATAAGTAIATDTLNDCRVAARGRYVPAR
jgi:hypothetical protein